MKTNIVNYFNQESYDSVIQLVFEKASNLLQLDKRSTVSVILVDDNRIQELNNTFRDKAKPTDVLTFPDGYMNHLGDIFISMETALKQASEYGHSFERELGFLAVHGLLHTLGYDHQTPDDEQEMIDVQNKILHKAKLHR